MKIPGHMSSQHYERLLTRIRSVVFNQALVPQESLDAYTGKPDQINLLILIVASAQNVSVTDHFIEFVCEQEEEWKQWALLVKKYREWLEKADTKKQLVALFKEYILAMDFYLYTK